MDHPDQVRAYAEADFAEGNTMFVDRLLERLDPERKSGRLVDLGCGPGDILYRLAARLPGWTLFGVDAGRNMLTEAERRRPTGIGRESVEFVHARLPDTAGIDGPFDAVVSNSVLHHLPDPSVLWNTVARLSGDATTVQVMDLERPESESRARQLVDEYAAGEPRVLREDFYNSLRAAWTLDEIREQIASAGLALSAERVSDRHWMVHGAT